MRVRPPRSWLGVRRVVAVALLLSLALTGLACGADDPAPEPLPPGSDEDPDDQDPDDEAPPSDTVEVAIYLVNEALGDPCTEVFPVPRIVTAEDPLTGALEALLAGPTDAEQEAGYGGWFSAETVGMLRSAEVVAGTVMIDLDDLRPVIPNASSSCGSSALLAQLDTTALGAADGAASVLYRLAGDPDAFYEWLQRVPPGQASPDEPGAEPHDGVDLADGRHPVFLHDVDLAGRTLTVDVIQFLTGQDAVVAYQADHPDDPDGPPNDYYIVNVNPRLRTLPVAAEVEVSLVLLHLGEGVELKPRSWATLLDDLAGGAPADGLVSASPFWLTLDHGVVVGIEEQYLP